MLSIIYPTVWYPLIIFVIAINIKYVLCPFISISSIEINGIYDLCIDMNKWTKVYCNIDHKHKHTSCLLFCFDFSFVWFHGNTAQFLQCLCRYAYQNKAIFKRFYCSIFYQYSAKRFYKRTSLWELKWISGLWICEIIMESCLLFCIFTCQLQLRHETSLVEAN